MKKSFAPWSLEQVAILKEWQGNEMVHPYTCEAGHVLVPHTYGWRCPLCSQYQQNWCHAFHFENIEGI